MTTRSFIFQEILHRILVRFVNNNVLFLLPFVLDIRSTPDNTFLPTKTYIHTYCLILLTVLVIFFV